MTVSCATAVSVSLQWLFLRVTSPIEGADCRDQDKQSALSSIPPDHPVHLKPHGDVVLLGSLEIESRVSLHPTTSFLSRHSPPNSRPVKTTPRT